MRLSANLAFTRDEYAMDCLRRLNSQLPGRAVFDIGAGDGRFREPVAREGLEWRGFDRNHRPDMDRWDLTDPPPAKSAAGAVLLLDVIEHCLNPGLALKHIAQALLPSGRLILTTPNPRWSGSRINTLVRGYAASFAPHDLEENHHVFVPWPHIIEKMAADAGLRIEEYVTLDGWTTPFRAEGSLSKPLRYALNVPLMAIERLDPTAMGMSFGMVARKL